MWLHHRSLTALVAGLLLTLFLHGTGQAATPAPPDAPLPPGKSVLDDPFQRGVQAWFGAETQLSLPTTPECDRYAPAVAFNYRHKEYLVLWHNNWSGSRDIYARRISETGTLLSWFAVTSGPNDRFQPAVAYNAANDEYLVVWMVNINGDGQTHEIWGRKVAWNGSSMGPEFQIITWPNRTFWSPRIAWNSLNNEYLVAWTALDTATMVPTDVAHALLRADGSKRYGAVVSTDDQPHQVDVTYNVAANEYMLVWRRMWSPGDGDIMGARISAAGLVVTPPGIFGVNYADEDQSEPSIATNQQQRYIVVWQHAFPGPCCDWDIRGQELDINGNTVGSVLHLAASMDDETSPVVTAQPGAQRRYLVTWQQAMSSGDAVRAAVGGDESWRSFDVATYAFWNNDSPAATAGSTGFYIAYEGDAVGDPTVHRHIHGRLWLREVLFLPMLQR
ncbi:MAG: hypothetical protein KDD78_12045 [Caldilineaceae bacterium]|nr:hypothetical protein [Caldilineaceae bacterium]